MLGVSRQLVSDWFAGQKTPSWDSGLKIRAFLKKQRSFRPWLFSPRLSLARRINWEASTPYALFHAMSKSISWHSCCNQLRTLGGITGVTLKV
jgi:hypothetical protein